MFDNIENIYIDNNILGKKYRKYCLPIIVALAFLMISLLVIRKIVLSYIAVIIVILLMIILKSIIYFKTVDPKNWREIILMKEKFKKIIYMRTKKEIECYLKENNRYNVESISALVTYYKDLEPKSKIDISKISNFIFSFLTALGVIITVVNQDILNAIYLIILLILVVIGIFYAENKLLDKLSEGILDNKPNYKEIYKMLTEIYLDILNNNNNVIKNIKIDENNFKYINRIPTANEFNNLTEAVGWGRRDNKIVQDALNNTLYSLCVYDMDKLIGYGRIIGDKTIFLYIHDVMVIPEYQRKQIGTSIMKELLKQIEEYKKENPNIRTYLGASKGKEHFYEKFGFVSRPNEELGAGMILYAE